MQIWLVSFILFFSFLGYGQEPSYYFLGATELDGLDIYDLYQAQNGTYWIATDQGIIKYNGHSFQSFSIPQMLSSSVFMLVEDYTENIYCHNLSGQIFRLNDKGCELYYTIPNHYLSADIKIEIDNNNQLVIFCKKVLLIPKDRSTNILKISQNLKHHHFGSIVRKKDSTLLVFEAYLKVHLTIKNSLLTTNTGPHFQESPAFIFNFINFNDSIFTYNNENRKLYSFHGDIGALKLDPNVSQIAQQGIRYYPTTDFLWLASNSLGTYCYNKKLTPNFSQDLLYPSHFISHIYEDNESNLLLGTFGEGIMVVPSMSTTDFNLIPNGENVISIAKSSSGELFFGTRSGKIFRLTLANKIEIFKATQNKSIEALFFIEGNRLLFAEINTLLIDLENNNEFILPFSSLKDIAPYTDSNYLIAANTGVHQLINGYPPKSANTSISIRSYCIGYDKTKQSIYAGTAKGLAIYHGDKLISYFKLNGNNIIARDIEIMDGLIYVGTAKNGILKFKNDTLIDQWNTESGLISNQIGKIRVFGNKLVVATEKGIQILSKTNGEVLDVINRSSGLHSENILDFEIRENELWIVHSQGIQKVMLNKLKPFNFHPTLQIEKIMVNDTLPASNLDRYFSFDEKKFTFHLRVNNLKYKNEISYVYQLEGAEISW
ncbi:MAG: hypothetical protein JKY54_01560, partial [Flavobacteriales bacterium]|nr:hypothetical protein [Flavobacteriales bacterium]